MKFKYVNLSLNIWVIASIILIAFSILIAQYFLNYSFYKDIQSAHSIQRLDDIANKAQALLLFPVASLDKKAIKNIVNDLMKDDEIRSIHIKDENNITLLHHESNYFIDGKNTTIYRKIIHLIDNRPTVLNNLFDDKTENEVLYGSVILYLTPSKYDEKISIELNQRSYIFSSLILVVLSLTYLITRKGQQQALRIETHINALLGNNYEPDEELGAISEFNKISLGLNRLGETLNQKINDLEKSKKIAVDGMHALQKTAYFKDEFIHIISHEIRTPVNTISNLIDILESYLTVSNIDDNAMRHYQVCKNASLELRELVDELVKFDKLERTNVDVINTACDLTDFFSSIKNINMTKFDNKSIFFAVNNLISKNNTINKFILIDSVKLKQIINNLLDNALKYTQNGSVSLQWSLNEKNDTLHTLKIMCKDSGIGIPDDALGDIFEPFYQVNKKRLYSFSGVGLGLSIIKKHIDAMGGDIEVSTKINIGTTFTLSIPVQESKQAVINSPLSTQMDCFSMHYTIDAAVIDDDENSAYTLSAMLNQYGINCRQFTNSKEAISELINQPADVIFFDFHMPELDGIQVAKQLQHAIKNKNTVLICVTADTHDSIVDLINSSVMDALIFKPLKINEVMKIMGSAENAKKITKKYKSCF